ncbi:uncharacterized protein LOC129587313 [Paramacrobiotus metropolitanus]|uniref:uncharacterized protein LOC129587313 n=1 Tax=Paramacrobiotus metropolitanus TaxID=2943436 RepID=UPI002445B693|nr:uncharacterized protein LOC129587313 [Paramacrobiotus metropolitanus]
MSRRCAVLYRPVVLRGVSACRWRLFVSSVPVPGLLLQLLIGAVSVVSLQSSATVLSPRCGSTLRSAWGNLTYPADFPQRPYVFGLKCRWTIRLPSPTGQVRVTFPYLVLRPMDFLLVADPAVIGASRVCSPPHDSAATQTADAPLTTRDLSPTTAPPTSSVLLYRGAEAGSGPPDAEVSFTAPGASVVVELCPSAFPLGVTKGLGLIFLWEDASNADNASAHAALDYDVPSFFPPNLTGLPAN